MDVQGYLQKRLQQAQEAPKYRELCARCIQPIFSCFCQHIQEIDAQIQFVILIHPIEVRRRIATGRMAHLCLKNSFLISGQDYTNDKIVNEILADSNSHSVLLYPGQNSVNLSPLNEDQRKDLFPVGKKLTVFVVDGTWATARRTVRQSINLQTLPRVCFSPAKPSTFRVRKQPHEACYSTIEAIHHTIELLGPGQGFQTEARHHDRLINVFDKMVEFQLEFARLSEMKPESQRYRPRSRSA